MGKVTELRIQIFQFFLTAVATVFSLFLITDEQIAGVLVLGQSEFEDNSPLSSRLRVLFKITLLLVLIILILASHSLMRKRWLPRSTPQPSDGGSAVTVVSVDDGIRNTIDRISRDGRAQNLKLWGYSLGWTARLSQHLESNPQPGLSVEIYVPDPALLYQHVHDPKATERAAVLRLRVDEWKALHASRRIGRLEVYECPSIPNDLGVLLDGNFALVHSYTWVVEANGLTHTRQDSARRSFLQVLDGHEVGAEILGQLDVRMLCRSHDSRKVSLSS